MQYVLVLSVASFCRQTLSLHYITVQRTSPCRRFDIGVMNLGVRYLFCCSVAVCVKNTSLSFLGYFLLVPAEDLPVRKGHYQG